VVKLGNGYKDAKWGMSRKEVRAALKGKVTEQTDTTMTISLGGGKELTCHFYRDRLRAVKFSPHLENEERDRPVLLQAMVDKYGPGSNVEGATDHIFGVPLDVVRWEDGETQIDVRSYQPGHGIAPSTYILYFSKEVDGQKEADEAADRARQQGRTREDVRGHL